MKIHNIRAVAQLEYFLPGADHEFPALSPPQHLKKDENQREGGRGGEATSGLYDDWESTIHSNLLISSRVVHTLAPPPPTDMPLYTKQLRYARVLTLQIRLINYFALQDFFNDVLQGDDTQSLKVWVLVIGVVQLLHNGHVRIAWENIK